MRLRPNALVLIATLLGFALRLPLNSVIPPRWDEGWSIAHASLSISEILRITAADVHPPLYYFALGLWQMLIGHDLFAARFLSVLMGTLAIPLIYVVAKAWAGSTRLAVIAAFIMAWLPLGVYYGAVVRMYALAPAFVLLAAYGALKVERGERRVQSGEPFTLHSPLSSLHSPFLLFVIGAAGAMLTLYHAAWALAAITIYVLAAALANRQSSIVRRLLIAIVLSIVVFLPWGLYAVPQFLGRAAAETGSNIGQQFPITYFIGIGLRDLTMSQETGIAGVLVISAIVFVGVMIALKNLTGFRNLSGLLALPLLMIAFTLFGVSFAARQWAFNARMLICAVPALALLLAWSFEQMLANAERRTQNGLRIADCRRSLWGGLAIAGALALIVVYFNTSFDFVYRKTLEVFDPYNPHTYHEHIAPLAQPNDRVFFNVLSPAGFYALDKQSNDPAWDYALTWDPVIEPRALWEQRINAAAQTHRRLWLVLYRGLAGKNGDLRGFMDSTYFPAHSEWGEEEVFYGLYGAPQAPLAQQAVTAQWGDMQLDEVRVGVNVRAGDVIPVALTWRALQQVPANYKVFVHAAKSDGFVVAQHDAQPLNDLRPMTTWTPNTPVLDHHGLALPADFSGALTISIGLYNADTGERLKTTDGRDAVEIATVNVNR